MYAARCYSNGKRPYDDVLSAHCAGCKCELRSSVTGCRIALVYDVISTAAGPPPALKDCSGMLAQIQAAVDGWGDDDSQPYRQIWMLDHQYALTQQLAAF